MDAVEWGEFKAILKRLDSNVNGNGKEPLEVRLKRYIDERDEHKERNTEQDLQDLETRLSDKIDSVKEEGELKVEAMHAANTLRMDKQDKKLDSQDKKLDSISNMITNIRIRDKRWQIAAGIVTALGIKLLELWKH